jgi:transposase
VDLTNSQWEAVDPLLPRPPRRSDGRGRPWREPRGVLNGILWILRTGAPWKDLPPRYPPYQTCHRRFQAWLRDGTLQRVIEVLGEDIKLRVGSESGRPSINWSSYPEDAALLSGPNGRRALEPAPALSA